MSRELLEGQYFTDIILFWVKLQNDMFYQDIYEFHDEFPKLTNQLTVDASFSGMFRNPALLCQDHSGGPAEKQMSG